MTRPALQPPRTPTWSPTAQVPVELKTAATMTEQADFAKYEGFTGIPDFGWTEGYVSADLLIKGLEVAGQNPTRSSFIDNLRKVTNYNVEGLATNTVNYSNGAEHPQPDLLVLRPARGQGLHRRQRRQATVRHLIKGKS